MQSNHWDIIEEQMIEDIPKGRLTMITTIYPEILGESW